MDPCELDPYESPGGSEESWRDSRPPPLAPRRRSAGTPARSPSPSSYSDGGSYDDDLPDLLARLCVFREEIGYREPRPPSPPLWEPVAAAAGQPAEEQQHELQLFHIQAADEPRPEQRLANRFRGWVKMAECERALQRHSGDHFAAHRYLHQGVAQMVAVTTPLSSAECHDVARLHWDRERRHERQQLAELGGRQRQFEQKVQAAILQHDAARAAEAQQELDTLWKQLIALERSASQAILRGVNQYSLGLETIDLHGQRAADARRIVGQAVEQNTQHWPPYRAGRFLVVFITGAGIHSEPSRQSQRGTADRQDQAGAASGRQGQRRRGKGGGRGRRGRAGGRGQHSQPSEQADSGWPAGALNVSVVREAVERELQERGVEYVKERTYFCAIFDAPSAGQEAHLD